ncbi:regulatory protein RecX [Candidatus Omnitrophota bacterium]
MNEADLRKARTIVFRLLKYRIRSVQELKDRLKLRTIPQAAIAAVLEELTQLNFVDDREFCRVWIQDRIRCGYGPVRIEQELRQKGISQELLVDSLGAFKKEIADPGAMRLLIAKRLKRYAGEDKYKIKRKLFNYLSARGFPSERIRQALEELNVNDYQ